MGQISEQRDRRNPTGNDLRSWSSRYGSPWPLLATMAWTVMTSTGMFLLWRYAHDPGTRETSPSNWPPASRITHSGDRPLLLLFAHPRCPCTHASLRELERLAARCGDKVESHVVLLGTPGAGAAWFQTDLRQQAEAIQNVQVFCDRDGVESERFRARTSGLAVLYSASGRLLFQGGITASRGHEGRNDGTASLEAILFRDAPSASQTPVFGCPLQSPDVVAVEDLNR